MPTVPDSDTTQPAAQPSARLPIGCGAFTVLPVVDAVPAGIRA